MKKNRFNSKKLNIIRNSALAQKHETEKQDIERRMQILSAEEELFKDTLHEVRKINNQIKSSAEQLFNHHCDFLSSNTDIKNIITNISQNSNLLSIRMDAYDMLKNPHSIDSEIELPLCVYKKIEKCYKCLYSARTKKSIEVILSPNERKYRLKNTIELAFFIILENAIKYTPDGNNITVSFNEIGNNMEVKFKNLGIRPLDSEIEQLTERGFRSKRVLDKEGSGLGLYLLNQICKSNNVKLHIDIGGKKIKGGGTTYSDFTVTLTFSEDYIC